MNYPQRLRRRTGDGRAHQVGEALHQHELAVRQDEPLHAQTADQQDGGQRGGNLWKVCKKKSCKKNKYNAQNMTNQSERQW